jgi:hypothetical protein
MAILPYIYNNRYSGNIQLDISFLIKDKCNREKMHRINADISTRIYDGVNEEGRSG